MNTPVNPTTQHAFEEREERAILSSRPTSFEMHRKFGVHIKHRLKEIKLEELQAIFNIDDIRRMWVQYTVHVYFCEVTSCSCSSPACLKLHPFL